jgi:hypothetical protein
MSDEARRWRIGSACGLNGAAPPSPAMLQEAAGLAKQTGDERENGPAVSAG